MVYLGMTYYVKIKKQMKESHRQPVDRPLGDGHVADEDESDAGIPYETDGLGQPYFSYESEPAPVPQKPKRAEKKAKTQPAVAPKSYRPVAAVEEPFGFDLRQAVIYQTVLNNPYVSEINQQNQ